MKQFIEQLISLLDKSVVEQVKHSQAFFQLIYLYDNVEVFLTTNLFLLGHPKHPVPGNRHCESGGDSLKN